MLANGLFDGQLDENALVMRDEIDERLWVVVPGADGRREFAGEQVERVVSGHVVLRLAGMRFHVEELGDDRWRLESLADDEEQSDDAANLMPQEAGSNDSKLAELWTKRGGRGIRDATKKKIETAALIQRISL